MCRPTASPTTNWKPAIYAASTRLSTACMPPGRPNSTQSHTEIPLYPDAAAAIKPGRNVVAVAARRNNEKSRGRHIDVGLKALKRPDLGSPAEDDADRAAWVIVANVLLNLDETLTKR